MAAALRLVAGVRVDGYRVTSQATPGYDVLSLTQGAQPPVDPATLPDANGSRISRTAVTGDIGAVYRLTDSLNLRARYGRSYRHPNLEELLFSGPATVGAIVPNMTVQPEIGHNTDGGITVRAGRVAAVSGSAGPTCEQLERQRDHIRQRAVHEIQLAACEALRQLDRRRFT